MNVGMIIGIAIGILFLVIVIVVIYLFVVRKRSEEEGALDESEADEIAKEMEQHQKEKKWEEEHMRPGGTNVVSDVPLSATEAHAHDREGKPKSYEELYGARLSEE